MNRCLVLIVLVAVIGIHAATAVEVTVAESPAPIDPGTTGTAVVNVSDQLAANTSTTVTDFRFQLPFETTATPEAVTLACNTSGNEPCTATEQVLVNVSVPALWAAGTYTGSVTAVTAEQADPETAFSVTVTEQIAVGLENATIRENISAGSEGALGTITVNNTGNRRVDYTVTMTGNLSNHTVYNPSTSAYVGLADPYRFKYDVPETTPFGYYEGTFQFTADQPNASQNITVATEILDEIPPTIAGVEVPDEVMATTDQSVTVTATDNLAVADVTGELIYETTEQQGNKTVTVNETWQELAFEQDDATWTAVLDTDRIDEFWLTGTVTDAAGNTVSFQDRVAVTALDAVAVESEVSAPAFEIEQDATLPVAEITVDTPVTVTLDAFDQALNRQNVTWQLGLESSIGRQYFADVGDTIRIDEAGDVALYLYTDEPGRYAGQLNWTGVEQHVALGTTSFYGEFTNFTQPTDQNFTILNVTHRCDAVREDTLTETGWDCSYFISAGTVPPGSSLEQEMETVVPGRYRTEVQQVWQHQLAEIRDAMVWQRTQKRGLALLLILLLGYTWWLTRIWPTWIHIPAISAQDYLPSRMEETQPLRAGDAE